MTRRALIVLIVGALATLLVLLASRSATSPLFKAEVGIQDFIARHGRKAPPNPKLIFLAIDTPSVSLDAQGDVKDLFKITDEKSTEGRALALMSQGWPWPRDIYPLIIERLLAAGARTVTFDLHFPSASARDEQFRAALDRYKGKVVIGSNFSTSSGERNDSSSLSLPAPELLPERSVNDPRIGFVNFWPDPDGLIRRTYFHVNFSQFAGRDIPGETENYTSLAAQTVKNAGMGAVVPADCGPYRFRYTAGPGVGYPARSVFEIFVPEYWARNFASGRVFDGAMVVVGSAGNWQHDDHLTPFGQMAGAEIQINAINALLHDAFVHPVSNAAAWAIHLLAAVAAIGLSVRIMSPWRRLAGLALLVALWVGAQWPLYNVAGLYAPVSGPVGILVLVGLFSIFYDLALALTEQLRLRLTLEERQRAQAMLEEVNAGLEIRVNERTADLTRSNAQLTSALEEKNVLLKEIHHRVKNNLQVISSLLNLQAGYITDPVALATFTESRNRVRSMALIHEKLYQSGDLARIDFEDYIKAVSSQLQATFGGKNGSVRIAVEVQQIMLPVDSAVPCGLIVNELVTNCFKYAFPDRRGGEICIGMKRLNETDLLLSVKDNGVGFPKDVDWRNTESLGMQLVTTLAEQLDGAVALQNGTGTTFEITFPENNSTKL